MADSFLGSGDLWIDRMTDEGTSTGLVKLGNATKFSLKAEAEIKEQSSKGRDTYGQVLATAVLPKPGKISISLNQLDKTALALAFLGQSSDITIAEGTVTDEIVVAPEIGKGVLLAHANLKPPAPVVTNEAGDITYIAGTNYLIDSRMGMLTVLTGIVPGSNLKIDYSYNAETGYKISGMTKSSILLKCVLDGKNFVTGKSVRVTVDKCRLMPSSEIDFLADDFSVLDLEGTMETLTGKSSPFEVKEFV